MSEQQPAYRPGEVVPESGIYRCNCAAGHLWSTDVKGHRFPPPPDGCSGAIWHLEDAAHPGQ